MAPINAELELSHRTPIVGGIPPSIIQFFAKIDNGVLFLTQYNSYFNAQGVTSDYESFLKIKKSQNRSFRHPLLDFPECFGSSFTPSEFLLFQIVDNRGHDGTIISDKPSVESD